MNTRTLEGKRALVTGASRGLGREIALMLADNGVRLALAARSEEKLRTVVEEVEQRGSTALSVPTDVTRQKEVRSLVNRALEEYSALDILINNAGVTMQETFWEIPEEEWTRLIDVNVNGYFRCAREVLRQSMIDRGRGWILNMGSITGKTGLARYTAYTTSKYAIQGMTNALAKELKDTEIRVCSLCPGQVETEMTDDIAEVERLQPEDVTETVEFLLTRGQNVYIPEIMLVPFDSIPLVSH